MATKLDISELDFDAVKANLKTYLSSQTEFSDYDFEGSGMSVLLDVLAYNTHYLGFNANMLANEMFLDSSQLRSSVVSHAKTLGYFFDKKLIDKAYFFISPKIIGGENSLTSIAGKGFVSPKVSAYLREAKIRRIGSDFLIYGYPSF